ncbi:hypothetical protein [uncultured Chitinophaga sp.]|uniref:hypothetical protein n=1 Tax=uncultured Chitinophaga sp. TaxID=339340 RepID=UPI0025D3E5F2|nr:hypothetical protein [uncultured Chitinophaga sp.]
MNIHNIRQNFTQNGPAIIILLVLGLLLLSLSFRKQAKGFSKGDTQQTELLPQPAKQS